MSKVDNYLVTGIYYDARGKKNVFSKKLRALSEVNAREKALQDIGSKQSVEKRRITIKSVQLIE